MKTIALIIFLFGAHETKMDITVSNHLKKQDKRVDSFNREILKKFILSDSIQIRQIK